MENPLQPPYVAYETGTLGPVDAKQLPRWAGAATLARIPRLDEVERADIKIVGAPFDSGVTFRPGARSGPAQVRESSRLLRTYNPSLQVRPFAEAQVVDAGDIPMNPMSIEAAIDSVEATSDPLRADGARLVMIGGDHTIALPNLRSLAKTHGPITVVHFDAHLDTWGEFYGAEINHGSPFRVASEEGLLDEESCLHVGIRGPIYDDLDLRDDARLGCAASRPTRSNTTASSTRSSGCSAASATNRCISPLISTCSTPRSRRAPARSRLAA